MSPEEFESLLILVRDSCGDYPSIQSLIAEAIRAREEVETVLVRLTIALETNRRYHDALLKAALALEVLSASDESQPIAEISPQLRTAIRVATSAVRNSLIGHTK